MTPAPDTGVDRAAGVVTNVDARLARRFLDGLQTPLMLVDGEVRVRYLNQACEVLLATSVRQVYGEPLHQVLGSGELLATVRAALREQQPILQRQIALPCGGGRLVTADCWATPLPASGTQMVLMLEFGILYDYPDQPPRGAGHGAQQELSQLVVQGLAHEIKNPLGGLRGAAQLLERELADPALREYTRVIIGEADRLRRLVDRMLSPTAAAAKLRLNVHEVLERVRTLVASELPSGPVFECDYDPSLPDVLADREQMVQVFLNLVRNAVQAIQEIGQRDGRIVLRTRVRHRMTLGVQHHRYVLQVEVVDNGPGVPAALREQIFLPLVTGRASGTGLGLSVAQSLVAQHGGVVDCVSAPGHTVFTVYLPVHKEHG